MVVGIFAFLCVIFFSVGCMMLRKIRRYFKDFYKQFGCKLWIANILLTLPLLFRGLLDAAKLNKTFNDYWRENDYRVACYNLMIITFGTYLPMLL